MIDYDKADDDPIVAEVRRAREELAADFNYELRAICDEMLRRQASTGRKYASVSPLATTTSAPAWRISLLSAIRVDGWSSTSSTRGRFVRTGATWDIAGTLLIVPTPFNKQGGHSRDVLTPLSASHTRTFVLI